VVGEAAWRLRDLGSRETPEPEAAVWTALGCRQVRPLLEHPVRGRVDWQRGRGKGLFEDLGLDGSDRAIRRADDRLLSAADLRGERGWPPGLLALKERAPGAADPGWAAKALGPDSTQERDFGQGRP
jgi:hypothetical protein